MTTSTDRFLYGGKPAEVRPAAGVQGLLLREIGGAMIFRVRTDGGFTDHEIRHDDLRVTIDLAELASFYKIGDDHFLDHSPEVLGLRKGEE